MMSNLTSGSQMNKSTYLNNLDDFLDDNLRSIADLITIKKGLDTDVKMIKEQTEIVNDEIKTLEQKTPQIESMIQKQLELQSNLEYQVQEA